MGYTIKTIDGELREYAFDFGGVIALRNFVARTNGNRLIIQSAENANFTILDALVNEVEIDGVVYDNVTAAQEALQRLVFNPQPPIIISEEDRILLKEGLKYKELSVLANKPTKFTSTAQIFALQFEGAGLLELGTTQSCDDLGELQGEAGINTINFGISGISEMWLKSSVDREVTIVTYNKI